MTKAQTKNKKHRSFFNILEIIVDIIVYPVIIISFMSSFFMLVAKSKNVITPIFGYTFVRVLTNSMSVYCPEVQRNFVSGDVVVLKTQDTMYEVGDVIAFYNYTDTADSLAKINLTSVQSGQEQVFDEEGNPVLDEQGNPTYRNNNYLPVKDGEGNTIFDQTLYDNVLNTEVGQNIPGTNFTKQSVPENRHDLDYVRDVSSVRVYFHQIVQIRIDTSGTIFYITKGTTNSSTEIVREDLVAGKYVSTGSWLTGLVSFCASTEGMILLVVAPISFIVLIELLSILEQVNNILLEKKVIAREMPFDSKECDKARIGIEMREVDKIFYYDVMPQDYKYEVFDFLWGEFENSKKKKEKYSYETAIESVKVYNMEDPSKYYEVWKKSFTSNKKKQQVDIAFQRSLKEKYINVVCTDYKNEKPSMPKSKIGKKKTFSDINKTIEKIKEREKKLQKDLNQVADNTNLKENKDDK